MAAKKFSRNPNLINGIGKFFCSKMYHKKGLWVIKKKKDGKFPTHPKSTVVIAPPSTTVIKPSKFYPADDVEKSLINEHKPKPTNLRASITPGTGLIILAGRFKEKRVVFLKQLVCSGLLLVSGLFKVNGFPLRRVNQAYVIATSAKVDVSGVKIDKIQRKFMLFLVFVVVDIVIAVHCQKKMLLLLKRVFAG
ncbi:60S ribosomal protein L6-like [Capsicum annuum]|uniref:60S ribosomal protein L6-like n=1 Tax=Capsicum annuum TaxID=4072 RepID=UPI001FB11F2B|nr:60S ribosomal protein L6-like [Capsicum annuum]XP_047258704.1 60S ribosomal protein L6-like [Capsicum annuum]